MPAIGPTMSDGKGTRYASRDVVWHRGDDPDDPAGPGTILDLYEAADGRPWATVRWFDEDGSHAFDESYPLSELTPARPRPARAGRENRSAPALRLSFQVTWQPRGRYAGVRVRTTRPRIAVTRPLCRVLTQLQAAGDDGATAQELYQMPRLAPASVEPVLDWLSEHGVTSVQPDETTPALRRHRLTEQGVKQAQAAVAARNRRSLTAAWATRAAVLAATVVTAVLLPSPVLDTATERAAFGALIGLAIGTIAYRATLRSWWPTDADQQQPQ